ncbi:MAG: T9SS type A sorting domain-containing protein [Bacteroidales bacterium]|nr:T9SS type A sorting domain-containing protein [Bacteroidales bacterium]
MKKHLLFLVVALCFAGMTVQAQQRKVLFEEFTASTCPPCYTMNLWLNPLLVANAEKVVVVKYQMSWPPPGDPYYTAEGGTRRAYYNVNSVPYPYTNGVFTNTQSAIQNAINNGYAQPAEATITGAFAVNGNNIIIEGSVTPLISGSGYKIHVVVNEKMTTGNKMNNGESEFHHVMMKMFPNGGGTDVTLTAGTPIPFSYSYDMSSTHVEEMDDLEVVVFVQNVSTKAVLNAAYLEDSNNPMPQNMTATQVAKDDNHVDIAWTAPVDTNPDGYNIYRDNVKINTSLVTTTTYQDEAPEYGKTYTYGVTAVIDGSEGYKAQATVLIDITVPEPINVTVKQVRGMKMLVSWEMPTGFNYPAKYYIYRQGSLQNSGDPTPETTYENTGTTYREYCFEVEPIVNEVKGAKSTNVCVTLINVPAPNSLKAEQVSSASKEVLLTWSGSSSNTAGYNIYRDDVLINTELVTVKTYTDVVAEYEVKYTYTVFGVAETGAESEKGTTASITLYSNDLPVPQNVQAQNDGFDVSVTWDAITDIDGYNVYRNDVKINTALVTEAAYSDIVPAEGEYCYKITAVVEGEESGKSEPACVDVEIVGIGETEKDALFTLYPNPVSGTLNIGTKESITDCQVFNLQGQLVYSTKSGAKEIATDGWASGVYIIRVTTDKGSAEKRVVKN